MAVTWSHYQRWLGAEWRHTVIPSMRPPEPHLFQTDSRAIGQGDWFIPIKGERFDGHDFIQQALDRGAEGFLYAESKSKQLSPDLLRRGIAVGTPLTSFQAIGSGWRSELTELKLIAVTGSSGKTTTRELVYNIISAAGPALKVSQNFNNEIGVPISLCQLKAGDRYACLEFGARHEGDIRFLNQIAKPNICALLNIGSAHVGEFGGPEKLRAAKMEMLLDSPKNSTLIAPFDDPLVTKALKGVGKRTITFGNAEGADVQVKAWDWRAGGGMDIKLSIFGHTHDCSLQVAHLTYPINVAAAAAMAVGAGIAPETIGHALKSFSGVKGRFLVHRFKDAVIIDDVYNANPESMLAGLSSLARGFKNQKKVVILGDMLELGADSPQLHESIGKFASSEVGPEALVAVGAAAAGFIEGAVKEGYPRKKTRHYNNVTELIVELGKIKEFGNCFYLKGSNGIKLSQALDALLQSFA